MKVDFSDQINDLIRILILLQVTKNRKSLKMTEVKIALYDYYLKFPCTMLGDITDAEQWNWDEYYAFFNWQPDFIRYRQSLNHLMAKGFAERELDGNVVYRITELGETALATIENSYKQKLTGYAETVIPKVIRLSDSKIEEEIRRKSNLLLRMRRI